MGMDTLQIASFISCVYLGMGIATLIQTSKKLGSGLPIVQGSSFSFIPSVMTVIALYKAAGPEAIMQYLGGGLIVGGIISRGRGTNLPVQPRAEEQVHQHLRDTPRDNHRVPRMPVLLLERDICVNAPCLREPRHGEERIMAEDLEPGRREERSVPVGYAEVQPDGHCCAACGVLRDDD